MIILQKALTKLFTHKIGQNALANLVRTGLQIIISFIGQYIIARNISKQDIGLWALVLAYASFLTLTDLGISQALIRFTANDEKNTNKYFWTTLIFYIITGLLSLIILIAIFIIAGNIYFKDIKPNNLLLLLTLLGTYLALISTAYSNVLNGRQMMIQSSAIEVIKSAIHYSVVLLLMPQLGIFSFAVATLANAITGIIAGILLTRNKVDLSFEKFSFPVFKNMLSFGIKTYGVALINQLKGAWLPYLTQSFFGIAYVAYTDYLTRIMGYFRQMLLSIILPLLPAAAAMHAKKENHKLKKLYQLSLPMLFILGLSSCLALILLIPFVINLWLGSEYQAVIAICQILCWAVFFNLLTGPAVYILQAINRQKPIIFMSAAAAILFFVFTYLGARFYGFNALFIGNVIAEAIASLYFVLWFNNKKIIES